MMLDTPATIAIVGNGPIGLEAALYARFLGYEVILVGEISLADMLAAGDSIEPNLVLSDLSSTLGRAALASHDEQQKFSLDTALLSCQGWYESYLGPLSKTDLLADQQQWQVALESITLSENGLRLAAVDTDDSLEVDAVIDGRGESPVIDRFYRLPEVSLQGITPRSLEDAFGAGLSAIQELFALLGGRQDLDLYDSVGYLPGASDST